MSIVSDTPFLCIEALVLKYMQSLIRETKGVSRVFLGAIYFLYRLDAFIN